MRSDVELLVDGQRHGGWLAVEVTAGIDRMARDFRLAVTDTWPGAAAARRIRPGDACELLIDGERVLSGYVDATPARYDARTVEVGAEGRSRTGDLVDSSALHASGQWRNAKVERIASDLCQPFGVTVRADADTGEPISAFQIERGESVHQALDRLIGQRALLATDDADGNLVITRAGTERAVDALVLGANILTGSANINFRERYSKYRVIGQRSGTDNDYGEGAANANAEVEDAQITRYRPLLIHMDGQATPAACKQRCLWTAGYRRGRSYGFRYQVHGFRQLGGALWKPNQMVFVDDSLLGIAADLLIAEVTYTVSEAGSITTLQLAPKSAYEELAEIPEVKTKATKQPKASVARAKSGAKSTTGTPGLISPGETIISFE